MSTPGANPPMRDSNEANSEQLAVARREGDTYGRALQAMAAEEGALAVHAGDYLVAFVNEKAEGMYELDSGQLVWREAAPDANVHLEVAVADAGDGRFVPGLSIHVDVERDGRPVVSTDLPFLWHPFLYHYGGNAKVPDAGLYDVLVRVAPASFMRHDPVNGRRYAEPVQARFERVPFANGRKASPEAQPRGADAPTAGVPGAVRKRPRDWADDAAEARTADDPRVSTPRDAAGIPSIGGPDADRTWT
jgi:Fe2+ transport protein